MAEVLKFTCSVCSEVHEGLPDFGFVSPSYYSWIPEQEQEKRCRLNADLCVIDNADDKDCFIRGVLRVPIIGTDRSFGWGVWSSLSERNFDRYRELWYAEDVSGEGPYFGWLSNRLPFYPDTLGLKLDVRLQNGGQRPLLELEPTDHPLAIDQREGLTWTRAVEMVEQLMHREDGDG